MRTIARRFLPSLLALAVTAAALAQGGPPDLDAIRTEYRSLADYIRKRPIIGDEERRSAGALGARLLAAIDARTADPALLAMAVQLATWSGSDATVDAAYGLVLANRPDNDVALSQWLTALTTRGEAERAVAEKAARKAAQKARRARRTAGGGAPIAPPPGEPEMG